MAQNTNITCNALCEPVRNGFLWVHYKSNILSVQYKYVFFQILMACMVPVNCIFFRCYADHRSVQLPEIQPPGRSEAYEVSIAESSNLHGTDHVRACRRQLPIEIQQEASCRSKEESQGVFIG